MKGEIEYTVINTIAQIDEVVDLQAIVWSNDAVTPSPQIVATIHNGGVVIGAYSEGALVGFCYGFAGFNGREVYLCSHMMGIHPEYRNLGIGRQLKLEQRLWALLHGYKRIVWTFDPLEARNGYLNVCKLGGIVRTYIESYYGPMQDTLNKGIDSDRFLLEWDLQSERASKAASGEVLVDREWTRYPRLVGWESAEGTVRPVPSDRTQLLDNESGYLISVPKHIQHIKQADLSVAVQWRHALRQSFVAAFTRGYAVVGMCRGDYEPVHYYVLQEIST